MTPLFTKLNLKDQTELLIINAPESFEPELAALTGVAILRDPAEIGHAPFVLAFVTTQSQVDALAHVVAEKTVGDAVVWFAYPKATSKKYRCEFNRDSGFGELGAAGFEPVRQVAIDEDWSAVRFRRVAYIKKMTRREALALTEEGKARARK